MLEQSGGMAYVEGKLTQAMEYAKQAQEILHRLEDIGGQIVLRADLATYCLADGDDKQARGHAEICLHLADRFPPHRAVAIAWHVLATVNAAADREVEAQRCVEQFVKTYEHIDSPDLKSLYEKYVRLLSEVSHPVPPGEVSLQEAEAIGREAMRLKEVGDYEGALRLLDDLEVRFQTVDERAKVEGARANVFQTSGRHREAGAAYRRASELFRECGSSEWADQVEIQCAASMRENGDVDGAVSLLRLLLERLPPAGSGYMPSTLCATPSSNSLGG